MTEMLVSQELYTSNYKILFKQTLFIVGSRPPNFIYVKIYTMDCIYIQWFFCELTHNLSWLMSPYFAFYNMLFLVYAVK